MMNPLLMPLSNVFSARSSSSPSSSDEIHSDHQQQVHKVRMVPLEDSSSFDVIGRDLRPGTVLELGRFTDELFIPHRISFRSKVVSRKHAIVWAENGKILLKDIKSSSGTFLNNVRLSASGKESRPQIVKDGDIVQLGINFRGGVEEIYRCVRMRFEIDRERRQEINKFSHDAYRNMQRLVCWKEEQDNNNMNGFTVSECCICLYAMAPKQAFFIAPCQHAFHYKCARPLLDHYPGFLCPLCRSYADLEASVAIDTTEMAHLLKNSNNNDDVYN